MVPIAWIYSIQFEFWSSQLHQHLRLHSTCHLNNKTYPLTPDLHWHQHLHLCVLYQLLDSCNLYKQMSSPLCICYLYTTTFPVYPLLTNSILYWIITNASTTDTTWSSYSVLCYLLHSPLIASLVLFIFTLMPLFCMLSFHSLSLLIRSSSVLAITTRSSAYKTKSRLSNSYSSNLAITAFICNSDRQKMSTTTTTTTTITTLRPLDCVRD